MSQITLQEVKQFLRVIHSGDDALIQTLIDSAEDEACRFLNRENLPTLPLEYPADSSSEGPYSEEVPSSEDPVAPSVKLAIFYLVQRGYETSKPEDAARMRASAETILMPYRRGLGV
jgi:hypothetical protein